MNQNWQQFLTFRQVLTAMGKLANQFELQCLTNSILFDSADDFFKSIIDNSPFHDCSQLLITHEAV